MICIKIVFVQLILTEAPLRSLCAFRPIAPRIFWTKKRRVLINVR